MFNSSGSMMSDKSLQKYALLWSITLLQEEECFKMTNVLNLEIF